MNRLLKNTLFAGGLFVTVIVLLLVAFIANSLRTTTLLGPISGAGHAVKVRVSDMRFGPGADFYCDVRVYDSQGSQVALWEDPKGQDSMENAKKLVSSMRWVGPGVLTFTIADGQTVEINLSKTRKGSK